MFLNSTLQTEFNHPYQFSVTDTFLLPAGATLVGFAPASSSSLLDSSLLELSLQVFAFLADGPLVPPALLGGAFRFLASGDLGRPIVILKREFPLKNNSCVIYKKQLTAYILVLNMSSPLLKLNRRQSVLKQARDKSNTPWDTGTAASAIVYIHVFTGNMYIDQCHHKCVYVS